MKKLIAVVLCVGAVMFAEARGHGHHPCPPPPSHGHSWHHHGGSWWGTGGRNFWPSFVGAAAGSLIANAVTTPVVTTPVVTTPVVVQPVAQSTVTIVRPAYTSETVIGTPGVQVWIEGRYVDQVQANGTIVRVWQPGHFEYR